MNTKPDCLEIQKSYLQTTYLAKTGSSCLQELISNIHMGVYTTGTYKFLKIYLQTRKLSRVPLPLELSCRRAVPSGTQSLLRSPSHPAAVWAWGREAAVWVPFLLAIYGRGAHAWSQPGRT